jgi:hypothetical protein
VKGFFNKIRKALRGGKPLPHEYGPASIERDSRGKWVVEKPEPKVVIKVVPATTSGKADCVCGHGSCKCAENRKAYAEAVAEKINKASVAKPTKLEQVKADAERMKAKTPATKKPKSK